jgi:OHCU decarboxylase
MVLQAINNLNQAAFVQQLGFVFEHSPWIAAEAWHARPFASVAALHEAMSAVVYAAPDERKVALIRAHPDLAGKAAIAGELTPESTREQSSAGLDRMSPGEFAAFTRMNSAYREKFSFPFIICVREHTKDSILANFAERLGHSRDEEISTALHEIAKIARLRLQDAVEDDHLDCNT